MSDLFPLLGWILALASTLTVAPQAIRLIRYRDSHGVSIGTPVIASIAMTVWVIFTASIHDMPALASSVGPLFFWLISWITLVILRVPRWRMSIFIVIVTTMSLIVLRAFQLIPIGDFGILAAIGSTIWALPQLVKTFSSKKHNLAGISILAYTLLALENAGWIAYSIGTGVVAYSLAPLVQLPACALIAYLAFRSRKRLSMSISIATT